MNTMNDHQGERSGAPGPPQMKRARKQGVMSASSSTTTSIVSATTPPPPLHTAISSSTTASSTSAAALFECEQQQQQDDAISITSTTRMSEECSFNDDGVEECLSDEHIMMVTTTQEESSSSPATAAAETAAVDTSSSGDVLSTTPSFVPRGFRCPLSLQVMLDPVLDGEGNTYEYVAIVDWLLQGQRTSPISHQPLSERMLNPNNSLREAIHEYMGSEWVRNARAAQNARQQQQKQQQIMQQQNLQQQEQTTQNNHHSIVSNNMSSSDNTNSTSNMVHSHQNQRSSTTTTSTPREGIIAAVADPDQRSRQKIDCFLQFVLWRIDGLSSLSLDEYGCCAFQYDGIMIVIDVPLKTRTFCFYTRNLVPYEPTEAMKDLLLELNFLQEGTRGGCLSIKRVDGVAEVLFSYNDRVANTSAQEFLNIFINFCITSSSVRRKLLAVINLNNNNNDDNVMPMEQQQSRQADAAVLSNKSPATAMTSTEETTGSLEIADSKPAASVTTKKDPMPPVVYEH